MRKYTELLTDMLRRHDERPDEHDGLFRETDEKLAALADAQIKTQEAHANADAKIAALAEVQHRTEEALTRLIVRVDKLTEAFARHADDEQAHG